MSESEFDVIVLGAGPAGSMAALTLAQKERRVVLVDRATFPRPAPCAGWLTGLSKPMLEEVGVKTKSVLGCSFRAVTFHNADFTKHSKPKFDHDVGYLIDRSTFDATLVETARKAGVEVHCGQKVADLRLKESSVEIDLEDGLTLQSRLLVLATGRGASWLDKVGVSPVRGGVGILNAQVEALIPKGKSKDAPRVEVVLGLDGGSSFGLCSISQDRVVVSVNWRGDKNTVVRNLIQLCKSVYNANLVPLDLSGLAASAAIIRSPAAVALDMETHVGKHCLVVGDAGGFVSAASNEGIYPAMWSAKIAAGSIDEALKDDFPQDKLKNFDSVWRMEMADHLRSPHTDIRFLLPLIFSNQAMADRMGAAFFFGDNI